MRERNGVDSKRTEERKELGEVERGETITRIYCVKKKNLFSIQRKNKKKLSFIASFSVTKSFSLNIVFSIH